MRRVELTAVLVILLAACSAAPAATTIPASDPGGSSPGATAVPGSPAGTAAVPASTTPTPAVAATATPTFSPAASPATAAPGAPTVAPTPPSGRYAAGTVVVTVTDALRMRSLPGVSADSHPYEPLLPIWTQLRVLGGPVAAAGYAWYHVDLVVPNQTLFNRVHEGWVAAGDHDGTPWLTSYATYSASSPAPAITGWPNVTRGVVTMTGRVDGVDPEGYLHLSLEIGGLLPRTPIDIMASGTYSVEWSCATAGGPVDGGHASGSQDSGARIGSNLAGKATATRELTMSLPDCPPGGAIPSGTPGFVATSGRWVVSVSDIQNRLVLTPPPYSWGPAG